MISPLQTRRQHLRLLAAATAGFGLSSARGASSSALLLCTNKGDKTLSLIDPVAQKQIATIPEDGNTGHEITASADGKLAYVPIYGDSGVGKPGTDGSLLRVIDLEKRAVIGTVDFGKGVRPHCPILCRASGLLYVTTEMDQSVTIIDPKTLQIVGAVSTGQPESHMLAISKDGTRGYTANVSTGSISVLDLQKRELLAAVPLTKMVQRISLSTDDRFAFTADQFNGRLAVFNTAAQKLEKWIEMPDIGYGTAPTPDARYLVVALVNLNEVGLVDLQEGKMVKTVKVPKAPQEVLVRPDGAVAYVSCDASKQIAAIELKDFTVQTLIDAGAKCDGLAWAGPQ